MILLNISRLNNEFELLSSPTHRNHDLHDRRPTKQGRSGEQLTPALTPHYLPHWVGFVIYIPELQCNNMNIFAFNLPIFWNINSPSVQNGPQCCTIFPWHICTICTNPSFSPSTIWSIVSICTNMCYDTPLCHILDPWSITAHIGFS